METLAVVPKVLTGNAVEFVIQLSLCTSWNLDTKGRSVCYSVWHREKIPDHGIDRHRAASLEKDSPLWPPLRLHGHRGDGRVEAARLRWPVGGALEWLRIIGFTLTWMTRYSQPRKSWYFFGSNVPFERIFLRSIYSLSLTLWIILRWFKVGKNYELSIYYLNFNATERILCLKHEIKKYKVQVGQYQDLCGWLYKTHKNDENYLMSF